MIAGDHHRRDAGGPALRQWLFHFSARRIDQPGETEEHQFCPCPQVARRIKVGAEIILRAPPAPQRLSSEIRPRPSLLPAATTSRIDGCRRRCPSCSRIMQQHVRRALGVRSPPFAGAMESGHALALGIERQFQQARRFLLQHGFVVTRACAACTTTPPRSVRRAPCHDGRDARRCSAPALAAAWPKARRCRARLVARPKSSAYIAVTRILFWVSVPVLSEQITLTEPSVSTAGRRRISACCLTICARPTTARSSRPPAAPRVWPRPPD